MGPQADISSFLRKGIGKIGFDRRRHGVIAVRSACEDVLGCLIITQPCGSYAGATDRDTSMHLSELDALSLLFAQQIQDKEASSSVATVGLDSPWQ